MRIRELLLLATIAPGAVGAPAVAADLPAAANRFFEKHCYDCHDAETKKGHLDLSSLQSDFGNAATFALWVKVHDRVRAGEMPPPKKEQPPAAERETMLKSLAGLLTTADVQRQGKFGRVPLRRLNRTEYENTIRDLFSLPGLEVKEMLPEDGRSDGFDKASSSLEISSVQLLRYLEAADFVLDSAIAHQDKPMVWKERFRRLGGRAQFGHASFPIKDGKVDLESLKEMTQPREDGKKLQGRAPLLETMDSLGILTHARPVWRPQVERFSPFHSGFYRLRTSVWSFDLNQGDLAPTARMQSFALSAGGRLIGYLDAPSLKPREHEIVAWVNAGEMLELNAANLWANFNRVFDYEGAGVAVDYVDVEGPLHDTWPPASHRRLFGNLPMVELTVHKGKDKSPAETYPRQPAPARRPPGARPNHADGEEFQKGRPVWTAGAPRPNEDCERLLNDFLPRAFRRPVPPEEVGEYVQIARERVAAGDFFETAMRAAYRVALCSPDFLFLREPRPIPTDRRIDHYALACRLSYFLWNSMPDDALTEIARRNALHGKELDNQIDRMIADPKSDRFIEDFLDQWVDLRKINFTSPDTKLYPEFRPDLRDAMMAETQAFFREMLTHDLGVANFIDSDFLMINQRLAEHYGVPGVAGSAIRRVPRPAGSPRGGLLTQGAILKITANGTVTSPILRGAWVMDRILGRPPQPPPPDVPAVDPDVRGLTTIRELLDKHRNSAACASCHAKIDPPGFALENFDVIGGWRTQYRFVGEKVEDPAQRKGSDPVKASFLGVGVKQWEHVLNNVRLGLPVDATGTTSDGQAFRDILEFKRILLAQQETIAGGLVERLILYATGAPVSFADRAQVEAILRKSQPGGYGLRTLVREVIRNEAIFQRK